MQGHDALSGARTSGEIGALTRRRLLGTAGAGAAALAAAPFLPGPAGAVGQRGHDHAPRIVLDAARRAELDRLLQEGLASTGLPGVSALVTIGRQRWARTLGVADLDTGAPFRPDGHVRIASITKTFAATAVLQLVDDGRVRLSDPLERFVPGILNGRQITVRDLLAMTSGVWDFTSDEELIARWDADPMIPWTPADTVALIKERNVSQFEPGTKVVYTDANYVLLGLIVEKATGRPVHEVINRRILRPLGLRGTRSPAPDQPGIPDPHPVGYRPGPDGTGSLPVGDINPQFAWTAGNMTSTVADLHRWGIELAEGRLLSRRTQRLRLQGRQFDGQTLNFGYGLGVIRFNDLIGHDGAIIGFSSVVFRYPQADATFVIVGNRSSNFTTPTLDIFLGFLQELYPEQIR